ncbi:hypothetical protein [Candidatus Sororendozoicomonas aggregata]
MSWLEDLATDCALHPHAEECLNRLMESYYLIYSDQGDDVLDD